MGIHQRMNRTMKASEVLPLTVAEIERDIVRRKSNKPLLARAQCARKRTLAKVYKKV